MKRYLSAFCFFVSLYGCGDDFFKHTSNTPVLPAQDNTDDDFCPICLQEFTDARPTQEEETIRQILRILLKPKCHSPIAADPKQKDPE